MLTREAGAVSNGARGQAASAAWSATGGRTEEKRGPSTADSVGTSSFALLSAAGWDEPSTSLALGWALHEN